MTETGGVDLTPEEVELILSVYATTCKEIYGGKVPMELKDEKENRKYKKAHYQLMDYVIDD